MKISVIIPTYNRSHVLARALDSVLSQTLQVHEIIVVDDGSTDQTAQLIKDKYQSVIYIEQANQGVSAARNAGILKSSGDWIALLDSDDSWLTNKLEIQYQAIKSQANYRLCHTEEIWIRNGVRVNQMNKHQKHGGYIFEKCLPFCVISPSSVLMERSVFNEFGLFDESYPACEDYEMWLRLCAELPVLYVETPLINKFGGHEDQLSRQYWGMDRFRVKALHKIIQSCNLTPEYRYDALGMLLQKLDILQKGAVKHGNNELLQFCSELQLIYSTNQD